MRLTVNLRHLDAHEVRLEGVLPLEELDIDPLDQMIHLAEPLRYDLEVQKLEGGLLVEGRLELPLSCNCVRCLKAFKSEVVLDAWALHLPLSGEDKVPVNNDCVDLTPYIREDILLEFPQHPLCSAECKSLPPGSQGKVRKAAKADQTEADPSAWAELNKLKF